MIDEIIGLWRVNSISSPSPSLEGVRGAESPNPLIIWLVPLTTALILKISESPGSHLISMNSGIVEKVLFLNNNGHSHL